ncbi:MAG TPA: site-2 protease family protein [bacterium]|nr:site-2 protease family protein [bacterium]
MISIELIPRLIILVFSVVFHEVAHGWAAMKKGDPTAQMLGRLTLNPIPHIDLFGTILLPLMLILMRFPFLIGSAKPVPVNPAHFRRPKHDMAIVAASGPGSNFVLAAGAAILFHLSFSLAPGTPFPGLMVYAALINLVLAFFNLIPIPPLDGSRIAVLFMSEPAALRYYRLERFGILIVLGLMFLGLFQLVIWPIVLHILLFLVGKEGVLLLMRG